MAPKEASILRTLLSNGRINTLKEIYVRRVATHRNLSYTILQRASTSASEGPCNLMEKKDCRNPRVSL